MPLSGDQRIKRYKQLKGSVLGYGVDFSRWLAREGLTASTATAEVIAGSSNVSISNQAHASGLWSADITAASTGMATIEVTLTPTTGSKSRKRRFCIEVTDPKC